MARADFLNHFIGREAELLALDQAWRRTRERTPQFVLLLGDSGFGKTRLIHEFYRRISRAENRDSGAGYWPDELDPDPITLKMNPDFPEGERTLAELPWFWWGLRWQEPSRRNATGHQPCALLDGDAQTALARHREPLRRYLERKHNWGDLTKTGVDIAMSLLASTLGPLGEVCEYSKDAYEFLKATRRAAGSAPPDATTDLAELLAEHRRDADQRARDFLAALLDPERAEMPTVPVILVLDDAQWADATTLRFVRNVFAEATRSRWRMLVIATCWETDWKEQHEKLEEKPFEAEPQSLHMLVDQLGRNLGNMGGAQDFLKQSLRLVHVGRFSVPKELEPLIDGIFPGLGVEARRHLLSVADGNPKTIGELLLQLRDRAHPHWFSGENFSADLTPTGLRKLRELPTRHQDIIESRLGRLKRDEPEVFETLVLASPQGVRFFGTLVCDLGEKTGLLATHRVVEALARAQTPKNLVTLFPGPLAPAEFKDRFAWLYLHEVCGDIHPDVVKVLCDTLLDWLDRGELEQSGAAPELLVLLLELLEHLEDAAGEGLRIRVFGNLVSALQFAGRYGDAVRRACELVDAKESPPAARLVAALDRSTRVGFARCLLDARRNEHVVAFAETALHPDGAELSDAEEIRWNELKARALHGLGRLEESVQAWNEAISRCIAGATRGVPSSEASRLYVGLARASHSRAGPRAAFNAYSNAIRWLGIDADSPTDVVKLRNAGRIFTGMAEAFCDSGQEARAIRSMERAERYFELCVREAGPIATVLESYAYCLGRQGEWRLHWIGGEASEAQHLLERALDMRKALARLTGETVGTLSHLAASYSLLAGATSILGDEARAFELVEKALALRREVLQRVGSDTGARRELSLTLVRRGDIFSKFGRHTEALADYHEALAIRQLLVAELPPSRSQLRRNAMRYVIYALRKAGEAHHALGQPERAKEHVQAAIEQCQRIAREFALEPDFPVQPTDLRNEAVCWDRLATIETATAQTEAARRCHQRSLELFARLDSKFGASTAARRDMRRIELLMSE